MRRIVLSILVVMLLGSCENYIKSKEGFEIKTAENSNSLSSSYRRYDNNESLGYGILCPS